MLKKVTLWASIAAIASSIVVCNAQNADRKTAISFSYGTRDYVGDLGYSFLNLKGAYRNTFGIGLTRYLGKSFDAGLMANYGDLDAGSGRAHNQYSSNAHVISSVLDFTIFTKFKFYNGKILKENAFFGPYFLLGLGGNITSSKVRPTGKNIDTPLALNIPIGLGVRFRLSDAVSLFYQVTYNQSFQDKNFDAVTSRFAWYDAYWHNSVGLAISFGKPKDTDGDGIINKLDKCPEVAGLANFAGCPDSDGDDIADPEDKCPQVKGLLSFAGCPDTDGDGVQDSEDKCPDVAGLKDFAGCPDTDGDGIEDSKDKCPKIAGIPALQGCKDTDGDGIADSEDACPDVAGTSAFNGCSDSDGDGIANPNDACPEIPGTAALKGCKDTDGDGIADNEDKCPSAAGLAENKGCPAVDKKTLAVMKQALKGVQFETGKDVIKTLSFPILDNVANILTAHPEYKLDIAGHTDNAGDHDKNVALSEKRAAAAKNYLIKKGVSENNLRSSGFGPDRPIADNKTPAGKALNRRVEFTVEF